MRIIKYVKTKENIYHLNRYQTCLTLLITKLRKLCIPEVNYLLNHYGVQILIGKKEGVRIGLELPEFERKDEFVKAVNEEFVKLIKKEEEPKKREVTKNGRIKSRISGKKKSKKRV